MYAYIKGIVDEKGIDRAVVEAAGVGYELFVPGQYAARDNRRQGDKASCSLQHKIRTG